MRPRDFEERVRTRLVEKLEKIIQRTWPDIQLLPFGSFKSNLYLPTADMDLVCCSRRFLRNGIPALDQKKRLFSLRAFLLRNDVAYENKIEVVTKAKVPLIKFTDSVTGLKIDISFEKIDGLKGIQTFLDWKEKYPAMPDLVCIVKQFLSMRGLNEPVNGGIGGLTVICLVVNLLNHMPQVQSGTMQPQHHLGEVLMEFFYLYGCKLNYETTAIRMNPPGYVNKVRRL